MIIPYQFKCYQVRLITALICGACGTLAFSPYIFWPSAIFSLGGLLIVTLNCNYWQAGWLGFIWGFGFFSTSIKWVYISIKSFSDLPYSISVAITIIFIIYLSFYPIIFTTMLVSLWPKSNLFRLAFGAPVLWIFTDFLRGWLLTGFPWLEFGYSQIDGPLKGIAPLLGVHAITFMLVLISGLIVYALAQCLFWPAAAAMIILFLFWPLRLLHWYKPLSNRAVNVLLVQGNIIASKQSERRQIISTINTYIKLTLPNLGKVQIAVWPESAIPNNEIVQNAPLTLFNKQLCRRHTELITGIINARLTRHGYDYYNSIIVLGETESYKDKSINRYDKHHLVPFGEILPLTSLLKPIVSLFNPAISSLSKGQYLQPQLHVAGMKITAAICYEIILGEQIRDNFHQDTDFLLVVLNDAWFGDSIGPWQHFQMARMRSLELGRPLLCSTNNGITAIVNADGTIQATLPQFISGVLKIRVTPTHGMTPYARNGSWPLYIIIMLIGLITLVLERYYDNCKLL